MFVRLLNCTADTERHTDQSKFNQANQLSGPGTGYIPDYMTADHSDSDSVIATVNLPEITLPRPRFSILRDHDQISALIESSQNNLPVETAGNDDLSADSTSTTRTGCACIACLMVGTHCGQDLHCRVPGCSEAFGAYEKGHEQGHFRKGDRYACQDNHCNFTSKRFSDLRRHYQSKHCRKPNEHLCYIIGCRYREIGFPRADKLKSHLRSAHKGMPVPSKQLPVIKPKAKNAA